MKMLAASEQKCPNRHMEAGDMVRNIKTGDNCSSKERCCTGCAADLQRNYANKRRAQPPSEANPTGVHEASCK